MNERERLVEILGQVQWNATRERVAAALVGCSVDQFRALPDHTKSWWLARTDAALSALQTPPKGWEVKDATWRRWKEFAARLDTMETDDLREITPHLLRDLADGVSELQIDRAWNAAADRNDNTPRLFLRALADTLEGKA